jgi:hypothetical protein
MLHEHDAVICIKTRPKTVYSSESWAAPRLAERSTQVVRRKTRTLDPLHCVVERVLGFSVGCPGTLYWGGFHRSSIIREHVKRGGDFFGLNYWCFAERSTGRDGLAGRGW